MDLLKKIVIDFELHHVQGIRDCFERGLNPNTEYNGSPLISELITMYTRTPRFKDCVQVFVDFGLEFEDKALLSVLLDDENELDMLIRHNPAIVNSLYTLGCTYAPLDQVTLLHICAEYNHVACAEVLLNHRAYINAAAGTDDYGFGGQTPIFHTVNSNNNNSRPMMDFLLEHDADLDIEVRGIIWGRGFDWETLIPAVNPISYAMMGLLPQVHRSEYDISEIVTVLLKKRYGIDFRSKNVPNKYLNS